MLPLIPCRFLLHTSEGETPLRALLLVLRIKCAGAGAATRPHQHRLHGCLSEAFSSSCTHFSNTVTIFPGGIVTILSQFEDGAVHFEIVVVSGG